MWLLITFLLLAGTVSADFEHSWKVGNEYTYLVRSRTLTSLDDLSDVHTGILIKALLTVQVKDSNLLAAKVWNGQYARIQQSMPDGWETEISDQMLELRDLPISGKPFQIRMKHGLIRDLIVDRDVPTWEVNMLKSIVGQLQVDTQGENAIKVNSVQVPTDDEPYASFKAMEDSVGGKCEVLYDIAPLSDYAIHKTPELVPMPTLKGDGRHMEIIKTKNFDNCDQRINYHFGMMTNSRWESGTNKNGKFFSKSSTSRIVISGSLKHFTIQSSVTTSKMIVSPRFYLDQRNGLVVGRMNLTLAKMEKMSKPLPTVNNPESTGNLVYIYNNPFSDIEERRVSKNAMNSNQIASDNSLSSSEEKLKKDIRTDTTSSSSSSISSSEENDFWQPKPTLEDAPQNSLLPNFIGYKGKHIGKSGKVDVINAAKELISQIANELEDTSNIPVHATLEKFTILCNLLRTMNRKQINELEGNMQISPNELKLNDKSQVVKQNTWTVFRDAITQAGTGPAFLTIKEWIERGNIRSMEATNIISKLPKTVRTPTDSYIRSFFELLQNPKVRDEQLLNTAATVSFSEMIHNAQVNKRRIHNNYPVHTFGRLASKHDNSLYEEYIPFLERELKKAHQEKDSPRIQTYIMALGMIGEPKILSVFEPYLEGKQRMTVFQRTLMVGALGKLTETNPKLARSVLYKIYLNTMESHEVRCTAVFLLMRTNPPLSMLQRMAEFTKLDTNRQVNSAVKSTLQSLMKLKSSEWRDLAKKARSVNHLLTHRDYDYELSRGYIDERILENQNIITHMILNYVGSEDSVVPRILYSSWYSSNGDLKLPSTEVLAMISSVKSFMELSLKSVKDRETIISAAEKIAEELKIVPEELVPLEGNFMINNKYSLKYFPFDKHTLDKLPTLISNYIEAIKEGSFVNINMLESYDTVHSFPTETGLPFVYTFNVVKLIKASGTVQVQINPDFAFIANSNARLAFSKNIQGRVGFVTPFEHRHFISGIDSNFHVYTPLKVSLDMNTPKGNMQWKIWPLKGEEKSRLFHYSVVPYVSNHDILNLRPLSMEKGTRSMIPDDNTSLALPKTSRGPFRFNVETGKTNENLWELVDTEKLTDRLTSPWTMDNGRYFKMDVYMNLEGEQKDPVILSTSFDSKVMTADTDSRNWTPKMMAVEPTDKQANSKTRRQEMMKEAGRGIESAKSYVVDVRVHIPGESESETVLTFAWSDSNVERKGRLLGFWRVEMPRSNVNYEVCIGSQTMISPETLLSYDEKMDRKPKIDFNVDIRYGESCGKGERIDVNGKISQSHRLKELVRDTSIIKDCVEEMKRGNKILRTCQKAIVLSMLLDEVNVSMEVPSDALIALYSQGLVTLSELDNLDVSMDLSNPKNAGKKKIDMRAKLNEYLDKADVIINTPIMDAHFKDLRLSDFGFTAEDILDTADEDLLINNIFYEDETSCMLDKTRAQTFDGKDYPLRLGACWHTVMTTYPRINPDNHNEKLHIPKDRSVSVLSRENESGQKEVKILLGSDKIKFVPGTTSQPEVFVNGEKIVVSREKAYQKMEGNEIIFEIYKIGDRFIALTSDKFDVSLALDGERVMVKASEDYRYSVRGLCGNFDHDSTNDFVGPKNCVFRKPEHFIASYALINDQCEGDSLNVAKSLRDHDCIRQEKTRESNVISDSESGRSDTEMSSWGYQNVNKRCMIHRTQVKETDDKICFTMRPVVSCASGCTAIETKSKAYKFHCMEKNEAAMKLKKRIEKGANPDLSQKPVSITEELNVPLVCKA